MIQRRQDIANDFGYLAAQKQSGNKTNAVIGLMNKPLTKLYERFLKIRGEPRDIALGFALGLFLGMTPTMGFQTPMALFFAALLKCNKISAMVGVWITNPFTAPLIYGMTYFSGAKILGMRKAFAPSEEIAITTLIRMLLKAPEIFWAMLVGGLIIGIPVALAGYVISYSALKKYQEDIKKKLALRKARRAERKKIRRKKRDFRRR